MKLPRRKFLHLAAGAAALPVCAHRKGASLSDAAGQIIVGYPAGGPTDIIARLIAQQLSERLGQQLSSRTDRALAAKSAPKRS